MYIQNSVRKKKGFTKSLQSAGSFSNPLCMSFIEIIILISLK